MSIRFFVLIVLLASLPLSALAVTLGPEVEMTERIADAGDGSSSHRAVAAWNGSYYVVWSAPRALMLSIFDGDGNPQSEKTLVPEQRVTEALIVNDGSRLLVVWSDFTSIRASALSEDGSLVSPGGENLGPPGTDLDIASSVSTCLVIWRNGPALRGRILDHDFQTVTMIQENNVPANTIRASSDGETFILTWTGSHLSPGLFAARIRNDGTLGAPVIVDPDPQASAPSIVWNGSHYLIASAVSAELRMTLVDREGTPSGTPFVSWARERVTRTALWSHRYGVLVVAEHLTPQGDNPEASESSHIHAFIVSKSGSPLSEPTAVSTVDMVNTLPALTSTGDGYFLTWNYSASGLDRAVRGTIIRANGEILFTDGPLPGLTVSRGVRSQGTVRVAAGSQLFLAVWVESVRARNETSLRFARLDRHGRSLDGVGIELHRSSRDPLPSFVCGSTRCLVVYQVHTEEPEIQTLTGRWISLDGRFITPAFTIAPLLGLNYSGILASEGERFATVAQSVLYVISPNESVTTTPVPGIADDTPPRFLISSNGDGFALFWSEDVVRCARFDRDGLVTGETTLLTSPQEPMAVAAGGDDYLLVTDRLSGMRISSSGVPIGGLFDIAASRGRHPSVSWNGSKWIVTWTRHDILDRPIDMYVTPVSGGGAVGTHTRVAESRERASVAGDDSGSSMLLFPVALDAEVFGRVSRLYARTLDIDVSQMPRRRGIRRP